MTKTTGARWGGRLVLALLAVGWVAAAAPTWADEPAKELTEEERVVLKRKAEELDDKAAQQYQDGKAAAAAESAEKALGLRKRLYPADQFPDGHPDLAAGLNNLGFLLQARGEYGKAEAFFRDAVAMFKRLYPGDKYPNGHPDLVASLNNLAGVLEEWGEYGRAEPYYRDALAMSKRLYPADKYPNGHPDIATGLNNLGLLLQKQGEYDKAEPYLRDSLAMKEKLYPADKFPNGRPDLAASLNDLGALLQARGEYGEAKPYYRDALGMARKLYPADRFPGGHPNLARSLNNLGALLRARGDYAEAEPYYRDALGMARKLYPVDRFPDGHPDLATGLDNLGALLRARGDYGGAEPNVREALEMYKRLYPADRLPGGHPDLARSLNNMGELLQTRGEYGKAEPYYHDALRMARKLYPGGHPDLAATLDNLGSLLEERGEYGKAEPYRREALEMYKRLYPADRFPGGHPDLARSLNNLGGLLRVRGEYGKAEPYYHDALGMMKKLYPTDQFPGGHPDLAATLNNVGFSLEARGEYGEAEPYYRDALAMSRRLYPADRFPGGHPDLARSLNNMGALLVERGENGKAAGILAESMSMYERQVSVFADGGAEAEVLNLTASLPGARNNFLAASAHGEGANPSEEYAALWQGKSALARGFQRRRRLLQAAADADEATRAKVQTLIGVRQDLSRLLLAPVRPGDADRARIVQELTEKKERLEKELAALLPPADRKALAYAGLVDKLPDNAVLVDLYRYTDFDPKTREGDAGHYAAFVLRKDHSVRRVELGDTAAAIDKDLAQWRKDVAQNLRSDAAGRLRKSVWAPITSALGDGVDTVYVCPDGPLSALPWPALPGDKDGEVLLEKYAFAVVPGGPFLLEHLSRPADKARSPGVLLTVGGVRYDRDDKLGKPWPELAATDRERAGVVAEARKLTRAPEIAERSGADATVARLVQDLPRARWAHLATHGFFAAPDSQEREHLFRPDDFLMGAPGERRGAAARNPLTLSGLVLAGANRPTDADSGVLTGEAVAGLNLDGMDLAVLSACQTGLGEAAAGEGVFGLQRAFHIGGARNVVASLWKVDDEAAAALMNLFYYHLWEKGEPPLEALHHAQLELYRNPRGVPALARGRGAADWDETVRAVTKAPADPKAPATRPAAVKDWAAFVLSGAGR